MAIGIERYLPNDEYQAATNSPTQATLANPFVTVADLPVASGDGIYDGSGNVPSSTIATLVDSIRFGDSNNYLETSLLGTTVSFSDTLTHKGYVAINDTNSLDVRIDMAANRFGLTKFRSTHNLIFEVAWDGSHGSNGTEAMRITSSTGNVGIGTTSTTPRLNVRGVDSTTGGIALIASGLTGSGGLQVQNDNRVGVGSLGATTVKMNVRGTGTGAGTQAFQVQDSAGGLNLRIQDDGLVQVQTIATVIGSSTIYGIIGETTAANTDHQNGGIGYSHKYNPSGNGTGRSRGIVTTSTKQGTFNSFENQGILSTATNTGTGSITANAAGYFLATSIGDATITRQFGIEANSTTNGTGTFTDFGGLNVRLEQAAAGAVITNMIGVVVRTPINTGATVTNTFGVKLEANTIGTNNYGIYQAGATALNIFQGDVVVGALTQSGNAIELEVTGDIEMIGNGKGFYMTQPDATRRYVTLNNSGAFVIT